MRTGHSCESGPLAWWGSRPRAVDSAIMTTSLHFEPLPGEPLSLLASPVPAPPAFANARVEHLEFSCRGDRVPCTLIVPAGEGPFPLVLLQRDTEGEDLLTELEDVASWVASGYALASIDLPLQGSRRSAKLTDLLADAMVRASQGEPIEDTASLLWCEFAHQATIELRRTLDILTALPTIDATRIAFAGFGLGAFVGSLLCAVDKRPAAVVLAGTGGGFAPPAIDPEGFVARIAPTPLLLINEEAPTVTPSGFAIARQQAEKLHAAAQDPKQTLFTNNPEAAQTATNRFLKQNLTP